MSAQAITNEKFPVEFPYQVFYKLNLTALKPKDFIFKGKLVVDFRNHASSLIFFGYWDRRQKTEIPKYYVCAFYILGSSAYWQSSG